jgi:sporulation protein YunB
MGPVTPWVPLRWKVLGILFLLAAFGSMVIDVRVRPSIAAISESVASRVATEAVNDAVQSAVAESPDDGKILHVETDARGNIRMATFDFQSVSKIQADATQESEKTLTALERQRFALPISQTIGGPLLSVFTPELPVKLHLVGAAHSSIRMDTHSIGINQSVHALYLDINARVQAVAPLVTQPVDIHTSIPLAYVVLNGEIPNTYIGGTTAGVPVLPPVVTNGH